jgi:hypothetical protein
MSQNQITPIQAFNVLDVATNPANAGKLTRADYANIENSLQVLADFIKANTPAPMPELPIEAPKPPDAPSSNIP